MKNTLDDLQQLLAAFPWIKHPEGGAFVETYRSDLDQEYPSHGGIRSACTAIYFLLQQDEYSGFHRIKSDEIWHFYGGGSLLIYEINEEGALIKTILGNNISIGEKLQYVVKAGRWFASKPLNQSYYSFVGCTVSPGFDFHDFELASKAEMKKSHPEHWEEIKKLCRNE